MPFDSATRRPPCHHPDDAARAMDRHARLAAEHLRELAGLAAACDDRPCAAARWAVAGVLARVLAELDAAGCGDDRRGAA